MKREEELKLAQQANRETEQILEDAQRITHVGSWSWNVETGEMNCSAETYRIYGEEPFSFQVTIKRFLDYVHPEDREYVAGVKADLESGRVNNLSLEFRIVRKDSTVRHIHSVGEVVDVNSNGKPRTIRGTGQDITERKQLGQQLADERDFVNAVIQTSGALITVIDKDGKITRFNKACENLTGYTADEVKGRSVFDLFIPPEERNDVTRIAARLFSGERRIDFENNWMIRSGKKRYIRWENSILFDGEGVPVYVVATGVDITDRRSVERELRESESRFRGIFNNVAIGMFQVDINDHIVAANGYICQTLGYSADELLKMDVHHLTAPEDRTRSDELNEKIHRKELHRVSYEKRYLKADGSRFWANVTVSSIRDGEDRHIGSITTVEDISERMKAEQALRESEERLRLAQIAGKIGTFEWNIQTGSNIWSPELEAMYGLKPGEFGKTQPAWEQLVYTDDRQYAVAKVNLALGTSMPLAGEWRIVWHDGSIHWIQGRFQVFKDYEGKPLKLIGVNIDITERKQLEEQIRRKAESLETANKDMERFNRMAVGREMRMIELKKEVNGLCKRLGEPPRYSLEFVDEKKK
jgi:PAS domain S-box-containing protein